MGAGALKKKEKKEKDREVTQNNETTCITYINPVTMTADIAVAVLG